jgi:fimbrial isopeptide formation D2 family protein/LPXTG-motif cell wall-anchored protein
LIYQNVTATVVPSVVDGEYVIYDEYEVDMKTSEPTITKTVSSNSSMMGGIVRYKLTITIPTFPEGATNKTFFVKDNMLSTGLTHPGFTGLAEVKCDDTNLNSSDPDFPVKASYSGSTVYFDIDYDSVKDYKTITIQYDAYINENAVAGEANTNTAELIYSNSPFVGTTYDPTGDEERPDDNTPGYGVKTDSTDVYTYGVVIHKTDAETGDALEGAVFGIYRDADCTRNAINCATMVDGLEENTITTDENGYAAYVGLAEGTYYLKEISAPAGYTLSDEVTEIKVNAENSTSYYTATTTVTYGSSNNYFAAGWQANDAKGNFLYLDDSGNVTTTNTGKPAYVESIGETTVTSATESTAGAGKFLTIEVTNTAGKSLPGTGGIGVVPFIAVGSVLMIGAVVVLVTRKRMRDVQQG